MVQFDVVAAGSSGSRQTKWRRKAASTSNFGTIREFLRDAHRFSARGFLCP